jgi:hypothetical protein
MNTGAPIAGNASSRARMLDGAEAAQRSERGKGPGNREAMTGTSSSPPIKTVVDFMLAKEKMESVRHYTERGRRHAALSDDALDALFVEVMRRWASDPDNVQRRVNSDDIIAEYHLRSREPPLNLVMEDVMHVAERMMQKLESVDSVSFQEIEDEAIAQYLRDHESAN